MSTRCMKNRILAKLDLQLWPGFSHSIKIHWKNTYFNGRQQRSLCEVRVALDAHLQERTTVTRPIMWEAFIGDWSKESREMIKKTATYISTNFGDRLTIVRFFHLGTDMPAALVSYLSREILKAKPFSTKRQTVIPKMWEAERGTLYWLIRECFVRGNCTSFWGRQRYFLPLKYK